MRTQKTVRLIKHEAVPKCGCFEVRFSDGRPSTYFYWDDLPSRRLRPDLVEGAGSPHPKIRFLADKALAGGCGFVGYGSVEPYSLSWPSGESLGSIGRPRQ